jgi:hypothetical protein
MCATLSKGYTFGATEEVTAAKLHSLVDSATIASIATADIANSAVTDAKIASVGGSKITSVTDVPAGAGALPSANLPIVPITKGGTGSASTTYCDLAANVTGTLPTANGGTGATAAANAANGVVVLNASSQLPAVSGALLTTVLTQVNDTDAGTSVDTSEDTFLSVAKTCTSGKTILLVASGYATSATVGQDVTIKLKHGSTTVQTVIATVSAANDCAGWSVNAIVTGLSGSVTFIVTGVVSGALATCYGNLTVLEF